MRYDLAMAQITSNGSTFDVADGTRLVLALEENGVEKELLEARDLAGVARLACQIECHGEMSVTAGMTVSSTEFDEPGNAPDAGITPDPVWIES